MNEYKNESYSSIPMMLYDEQFSISGLKGEIQKKEELSNTVVEKIKHALATDIKEDDFRLVVDVDDDFKDAYKAGDIKLLVGKNGDVFAQIKQADGKFGKKLPIKEELVEQGVTSEDIQLAIQTEMLQKLLIKIIDVLDEIDGKIERVIQGQKNDRLGLYYSGMNLYLESKTIRDDTLKKQMIAQAIRALSEAGSQFMQELRFDIQYLANGEYKKEKKQVAKINERMDRIRENFEVIYRAYILKAMIYSDNNENYAMLTVLEEYGRFINQMIAPYAALLTECDPSDTLLVGGMWDKRAETLIECKNIKELLDKESTIYLVKEKD